MAVEAQQRDASADEIAGFLRYLITEEHILQPRQIPGGQWAGLKKFMFTWAIVTGAMFDTINVGDRWCYHALETAAVAFEAWDGTGEPEGWHRHPLSGRRKAEDGTEYVAP